MTVHVDCASCGVEFCMTDALYQHRHRDGGSFYCPNGHSNVYRPSADQKRIAELEGELTSLRRTRQRLLRDYDELSSTREALIAEVKQCPGRCGWRSRRQVPRDPVAMGRGLERVRMDVVDHLVHVHGVGNAEAMRLLEAGT